MKIRAVLIGIEKYTGGVPSAPVGPCQIALDMAQWLIDRGTPEARLHLFLSPENPLQHSLAARLPKFATLNEFLRTELPNLLQPDELLFFYWGGHGITIQDGQRVVLYQDYSEVLKTYALSMTELSVTLDDPALFKTRDQLLLIDACANRLPTMRPQPQQASSGNWGRSGRYEFHAALEGEYSTGEFSRHLLDFLRTGAQWDNAARFSGAFAPYLANQNFRAYTVEINSPQGKKSLDQKGTAAPAGFSTDLLRALQNLNTPPQDVQTLYQRSIEGLRLPALWNATSVATMLKELQSLKDERTLIEFLVRARRAAPSDPINDWLKTKPANIVQGIESDLDRVAKERYLVFVLSDDPMKRGQIASVEARLFPENFADPIANYARTPVADWEAAAHQMAAILHDANARPGGKLHLQFVVSVPMLASAPHQIEDFDACVFGTNFPAVLRNRDRFYRPDNQPGERWRRRAEEIRKTAGLLAHPLPGQAGKALVEALKAGGVYYLNVPVACQRKYSASPSPVMAALRDAVDLGVPFLCFLHEPTDANWQPILEQRLNQWLQDGLRNFPARLCDERANYDDYASGVSVLWDDPTQLPKAPPMLEEVR